jgi:hypothetical protein
MRWSGRRRLPRLIGSVPFLTFCLARAVRTVTLWSDSAMPSRLALTRATDAASMRSSLPVTLR